MKAIVAFQMLLLSSQPAESSLANSSGLKQVQVCYGLQALHRVIFRVKGIQLCISRLSLGCCCTGTFHLRWSEGRQQSRCTA